jgi:hypothetical protein
MVLKLTTKQEITYGWKVLPKANDIHAWKHPQLTSLSWLADVLNSGLSNSEFEYLGEFETEFDKI